MYNIRQSLAASLCAVIGIFCIPPGAQSATMRSLSSADRAFMMKASEGNIGEIAAGTLGNSRVVAYAKRSLPVLEEHLLLAKRDAARMHMTAQQGEQARHKA